MDLLRSLTPETISVLRRIKHCPTQRKPFRDREKPFASSLRSFPPPAHAAPSSSCSVCPRMADLIALDTSDSPAKHLTVSRAVLAAHSTVFRDVLSIPTSAPDVSDPDHKDCSVAVAETEAEIAPFLSILTGKFDEPLELSEDQWKDVAKLADKYDSKVMRFAIESQIRCALTHSAGLKADGNAAGDCSRTGPTAPFRSSSLPRPGFQVSSSRVLSDACKSTRRTWRRFRRTVLPSSSPSLCASKVVHLKNAAQADAAVVLQTSWTVELKQHASTFILRPVPRVYGCDARSICSSERVQLSWFTGIQLALTRSTFDCFAPFNSHFLDVLEANHICTRHALSVMANVDDGEAKYRKTAPPFPA